MQKNVFRPYEIKAKENSKYTLGLVHDYAPPKEEKEEVKEEYKGPTVEELKKEAEAYKVHWENEKKKMKEEAEAEAKKIVQDAERTAFEEVKRQTNQAQEIRAAAQKEAEEIVRKAKDEAARTLNQAKTEAANTKDAAYKEGYDKGVQEGFTSGKDEEDRLISRVHKILDAVIKRREEILLETEEQIVDLVILMARKVVKVITKTQEGIISENVLSALKKVKSRGNVTIRVNTTDLKLTTEHIDDFIKQVEKIEGITVIEDGSIEKGGCIVDTDFGSIDAKISSQLSELEERILEVSPEKTTTLITGEAGK